MEILQLNKKTLTYATIHPTLKKFVHTNLLQGFELGSLGPQVSVFPIEPLFLIIQYPLHYRIFLRGVKQGPCTFWATRYQTKQTRPRYVHIPEQAIFNSCLKFSFGVVYKIKKGYPISQIKIHEPYPDLNGGQHIRRTKGLVCSNHYKNLYLRSMCMVHQLKWLEMTGTYLTNPDLG